MTIKDIPIDNRYGKKPLEIGDLIQEGDLAFCGPDSGFKPSIWVNTAFDKFLCPIFRRINVGEGFELVPWKESINDSEYTHDGVTWCDFGRSTSTVESNYAAHPNSDILAFRRKVSKPVEAPKFGEWVSVSESSLPDFSRGPVWVYRCNEVQFWTSEDRMPYSVLKASGVTHFQYANKAHIPPPPAQPDPDEEARESAWNRYVEECRKTGITKGAKCMFEFGFDAALTHARKGSKQ